MQVTKVRSFILLGSALLCCSLACAPHYSPGGSGDSQSSSETGSVPELNDEVIRERINDARVFEVLPESGTGDPISWGFDEDEPKEITVVDKQVNGGRATIVLDIKTQSSLRANIHRSLAGQIRTEWELHTGLVLRRWQIARTENISMKYKDLPKPTPQNSNR